MVLQSTAYLNASDAITDVSYMDFAIAADIAAVEGLSVGFGMAETEETMVQVIDDYYVR